MAKPAFVLSRQCEIRSELLGIRSVYGVLIKPKINGPQPVYSHIVVVF